MSLWCFALRSRDLATQLSALGRACKKELGNPTARQRAARATRQFSGTPMPSPGRGEPTHSYEENRGGEGTRIAGTHLLPAQDPAAAAVPSVVIAEAAGFARCHDAWSSWRCRPCT